MNRKKEEKLLQTQQQVEGVGIKLKTLKDNIEFAGQRISGRENITYKATETAVCVLVQKRSERFLPLPSFKFC